ncbi:aromatic acid exporter family protein [Streptomyces prasinus]|uniref:aromatic acid exporter family protein n=1 Tax=Streptomyces prasinus TaxID=67345 RepID=UPI00382FB306
MSAPRSRRTARGAGAVARRAVSGLSGGGRRVALDVWLLLQATASATAAWLVARYVFDHPAPYFAPITAMVALTANLGERGLHAIRLLQGVLLGLLVGQLVLALLGEGPGTMALAVFVSLATARALRSAQIVVVQAAVSSILVVALGDQANGVQRLVDALTGAGIALVFSQLLFPPEPLALLRRAETAALDAIAGGLTTLADAIDRDDDSLAQQAVGELREVLDHLLELRRVGRTNTRVTRRVLMWRAKVVVREKENAEHLDLLGASCLMFARLVASAGSETRERLQEPVRGLTAVIASLADGLDDRDTRQRAADRSLELATRITAEAGPADTDRAFLAHSLRTVATDVVTFAGVDLADVLEAIRTGALDRRVPPATMPPGRLHRWAGRLMGRLLGRPERLRGGARRSPSRSGTSKGRS